MRRPKTWPPPWYAEKSHVNGISCLMAFYLHLLLKIVPVLHFQVSSAPIWHYFPEHRHICDKVYPSVPWATYMDRFWPETVMGNAPLRGSLRAALIACSRYFGAVTGRKYHYRLFRVMTGGLPQTALGWTVLALHLWCHLIDRHSDCLQVVVAHPPLCFPFQAEQLTYPCCWIWPLQAIFVKEQIRENLSSHLLPRWEDVLTTLKIKFFIIFPKNNAFFPKYVVFVY